MRASLSGRSARRARARVGFAFSGRRRQKSRSAALPGAPFVTADRRRPSPHTGSCAREQRVLAAHLPERRACRSRDYSSLSCRRVAGASGATGHGRNSAGSSPSPGATELMSDGTCLLGGLITSPTGPGSGPIAMTIARGVGVWAGGAPTLLVGGRAGSLIDTGFLRPCQMPVRFHEMFARSGCPSPTVLSRTT